MIHVKPIRIPIDVLNVFPVNWNCEIDDCGVLGKFSLVQSYTPRVSEPVRIAQKQGLLIEECTFSSFFLVAPLSRFFFQQILLCRILCLEIAQFDGTGQRLYINSKVSTIVFSCFIFCFYVGYQIKKPCHQISGAIYFWCEKACLL